MSRVKICGVTQVQQAKQILALGADYIGLVFCPRSTRHLSIEQAQAITNACGSEHVVAVFRDASLIEINKTLAATNINIAQLYAENVAELYQQLPQEIVRIVAHPDAANIVTNMERDFIMLDGANPGSGETHQFPAQLSNPERSFIAGGLRQATVASMVAELNPFAVDVSSAVEQAPGIKDLNKVAAFIEEVKHVSAA